MPLKDNTLQQQLERAKTAQGEIEKGLGDKTPKKQAIWRKANARVRQIETRLKAFTTARGAGEAESSESSESSESEE